MLDPKNTSMRDRHSPADLMDNSGVPWCKGGEGGDDMPSLIHVCMHVVVFVETRVCVCV